MIGKSLLESEYTLLIISNERNAFISTIPKWGKKCVPELANKLSLEIFLENLLLFQSTKQMCSKYMQTFTDPGSSLDKEVQIVVYYLGNMMFTAATSNSLSQTESKSSSFGPWDF